MNETMASADFVSVNMAGKAPILGLKIRFIKTGESVICWSKQHVGKTLSEIRSHNGKSFSTDQKSKESVLHTMKSLGTNNLAWRGGFPDELACYQIQEIETAFKDASDRDTLTVVALTYEPIPH